MFLFLRAPPEPDTNHYVNHHIYKHQQYRTPNNYNNSSNYKQDNKKGRLKALVLPKHDEYSRLGPQGCNKKERPFTSRGEAPKPSGRPAACPCSLSRLQKTYATVDLHHCFCLLRVVTWLYYRSSVPPPKNRFWKGEKILLDEQSHGSSMQWKILEHKKWNSPTVMS